VPSVAITVERDRISRVAPNSEKTRGSVELSGLTLPGLANAHSHAFHRALWGRTQSGEGSFWTWRTAMYRLASQLETDSYFELAKETYREMVRAGYTVVGEFHYLHHDRRGRPYADPNAMSRLWSPPPGLPCNLCELWILRLLPSD
jgi:cytosine/adenosine deaminase-related metal-dependent hydrolase